MKRNKQVLLLSALVLLCTSLGGFAAAADNCIGRYNNVNQHFEKIDLGNGVSIAVSLDRSTSTSENTPYVGVGGCAAYIITMPGDKVRVVYACARGDKDKGVWVDEGTLEPGADKGTWKVTSATGNFASTIGNSGWWQGVLSDGKTTTGVWGGNCK